VNVRFFAARRTAPGRFSPLTVCFQVSDRVARGWKGGLECDAVAGQTSYVGSGRPGRGNRAQPVVPRNGLATSLCMVMHQGRLRPAKNCCRHATVDVVLRQASLLRLPNPDELFRFSNLGGRHHSRQRFTVFC